MILRWRELIRADRPLLRTFTCTGPRPKEPGRRSGPHPKPFEVEVQSAVRTLTAPLPRREGTAMAGLDSDGAIGAIAVWSSDDEARLHKIRLIAVARHHRGTSGDPERAGHVARETFGVVLSALARRCPGDRVYGLVHHRNTGSLRLLREHGFAHLPNAPVADSDLEMWTALLPR